MNALLGNLKSKTSWLGTGLVVFGTLYDQWPTVAQLIPQEYLGKSYAAVGVVVLLLRNLTNKSIAEKASTPILPPPNNQGGFARVGMMAALAAMSLVLLAGCATSPYGKRELSATGKAVVQSATVVAMSEYLRAKPDAAARIENIRQFAQDLKTVQELTTVDALRDRAVAFINERYPNQYDRMNAIALLEIFDPLLREQIGDGALDKYDVLYVNDFADMLLRVLPPAP